MFFGSNVHFFRFVSSIFSFFFGWQKPWLCREKAPCGLAELLQKAILHPGGGLLEVKEGVFLDV